MIKTVKIIGPLETRFTRQHFALLSKKPEGFKIINPFSSCRGWMSDYLHLTKTHPDRGYKPEDFDINKGSIYVGISFESRDMKGMFLSHIDKLHEKENIAKVKNTVVYNADHELFMVVEGSSHWKNCLWKMQLYTYYLRSMCYKDMRFYGGTADKLNHAGNELKLLSKLKTKYEVYGNVSIHGQTGPNAICTRYANPAMSKYLGVTTCP